MLKKGEQRAENEGEDVMCCNYSGGQRGKLGLFTHCISPLVLFSHTGFNGVARDNLLRYFTLLLWVSVDSQAKTF